MICRRRDAIEDPLSILWLAVIQLWCKGRKTLPVTLLNSVVMTMKTDKEIERKEIYVPNTIYVAI